ncbi:MAG: type-F conjugative transfer system pilin assembly protein TraF [Gammaproteobacteria bacterium]|nr:type-F conjugative transfer system pilin assembly protein TraF [Gammaproteobacteria bacterium]MCW5583545.1 type-F conjugative transfer system pilin assembly protein TraF [Gammaproteobacteria bacterium]
MMSHSLKLIIGFLCISYTIFSMSAYASDNDYYNEHAKGWHWYDDPKNNNEDDEVEASDPVVQMDAVRSTIKRALDQAVLYPTKENIKNYKIVQDQLSRQAEKFSNKWKEVLLENPELDYSLIHPTNNAGRMIESDQNHAKEDTAIKQLASTSGLFFFYHSTCPYCRSFAPIVKQFAESYGIKVIPITTDGISLPEFPNSYINQGQAQRFGVRVEPALFAVNPYTERAFPITYGLISLSDLKRKVYEIATGFGEKIK